MQAATADAADARTEGAGASGAGFAVAFFFGLGSLACVCAFAWVVNGWDSVVEGLGWVVGGWSGVRRSDDGSLRRFFFGGLLTGLFCAA